MNEARPPITPAQTPTIRPVGPAQNHVIRPPSTPTVHVPGVSRATVRPPQDSELIDPLAANSAHMSAGEPLMLVEEAGVDAVAEHQKKIRSYDEAARHRSHEWKRQLNRHEQGATRVKSFHGKYSDQGLAFLDDSVNEWLDSNPDVDVKFVTSTVGMFDGKIKEPALVLNLWY